jgi:hypothetical protein
VVAADLEAARAEVAELSEVRAAHRRITVTVWEGKNRLEKEVDPLDHARSRLRLPGLQRVIQRGRSDALFDLELEGGKLIPVGTMRALEDPSKVRPAIAECLPPEQLPPPRYTREKWDPVFECLCALRELVESETTPDDVTRGWLARYVRERPTSARDLSDPEERREAVTSKAITGGGVDPFRAEDCLYLYLSDFETFVKQQLRHNVSLRDLSARLERLGFEAVIVRDPGDPRREEARRRFKRSQPGFRVGE